MHAVTLTWQQAGDVAGVLAISGLAMAAVPRARVRAVGAFVREAAMVAGLFALWQLANTLAAGDGSGAFARARWIRQFEHALPLPSERTVQRLVLPHPLVVQAANLFYASMHMTVMGVFLVWLFVRHRDRYRPIRSVVAVATLGCLLVQLMPVAPPRMLPGIVDTGRLFGQSVYSSGLPIDQLSAMPSIHVAWATIVGWYAWQVSSSRWRVLGPVHAAVTCLVVVVTANHWWLDGIVAVAIVVAAAWLVAAALAGVTALAACRRAAAVPTMSGGRLAGADDARPAADAVAAGPR